MSKINVLIFPAGEVNSVELHDALSTCVNIKLFGASSTERHGAYIFENYTSNIPFIHDTDFIEKFNLFLEKNKIDIIFPTHDTVALYLVKNKSRIKSKIIAGDLRTCEICRSKAKTHDLFEEDNIMPKRYIQRENINDYPVFSKPDIGQGAVGAKIINNAEQLSDIDLEKCLITEYLPGEEYTVDCLTDKDGILRGVFPRIRSRIMAGICVSGKSIEITEEIKSFAEIINSKLNFCGLWYFQIKKNRFGDFKLLEISTRCSGTMCLTRALGVNLPLLSVYISMGYEITLSPNCYNIEVDRTLISRYKIDYHYDNIYIDFDDTIVINNKVHLPAIKFIYQCCNLEKRVVLISRHNKDIYKSLEKFAISPSLFSRIIIINDLDEKYKYISSKSAIFIDNSFIERYKVLNKLNIPVFDVDGIETLLDWRR